MGLGPRSAHKAGSRFPAGGKRGLGAKGSGRPGAGRQRHPCPPSDRHSDAALAAQPHLSPEALGYFRRALSALKEAPETGEERGREHLPGGAERDSVGIKCRISEEIALGSQIVAWGLSFIHYFLPTLTPASLVDGTYIALCSQSLKNISFLVYPELMVHNVLKEVEAQTLALATNRTGSEMLQELLGFSPLKPLCRVWAALCSNLRLVACHRCAVHVLQSALLQLPRLLGSLAEEDEEEDGKDGPLENLEDLVLGLASEVCDDFLFYCGDTHGTFLVRTLLQVLGGTLLESQRAKHHGSQSPGK